MTFLVLFFVLQAQAAISNLDSTISPIELLSMPDANRVQIAKGRAQALYPEFIKIAFSEDRSVQTRWKALITAVQINPHGSNPDIQRAIKHKEWFMRSAALQALKSINPGLAEKAAVEMMSDKALMVRSAAVSVIPDESSADTRSALWAEIRADHNFRKGQSLWVREEILEKLAAKPEKYEYAFFASALKDRDEKLALPAMVALEKLTHKKLGRSKTSEEEKRKLWVQYTKEHSVLK